MLRCDSGFRCFSLCCFFCIISRQSDLNCKFRFLVGRSSLTSDSLSLVCFESALPVCGSGISQRGMCTEFGDSLYFSFLFSIPLLSFIAIVFLALVFWFPSPDSLSTSCTAYSRSQAESLEKRKEK